MTGTTWVHGQQNHNISGTVVFTYMDSHGLPFDVIKDILRKENLFFDVESFIISAKQSGNYDDPFRLMNLLLQDFNETEVKLMKLPIMALICKHYND